MMLSHHKLLRWMFYNAIVISILLSYGKSTNLFIFNFRGMKHFIKKTILFLLVPFLLLVLSFFVADGTTDEFYIRFTTPEQNSMIVGTSRAAQDILPAVIDSVLNNNHLAGASFNYAFTVAHSPYGPAYYESIKKKLNKNSKEGKFIVAVDPWSLSLKEEKSNDRNSFQRIPGSRKNQTCKFLPQFRIPHTFLLQPFTNDMGD